MDITEFRKDYLEEVKATAAAEGEGSNSAFVNVTSEYLINSEVLPDFVPSFYSGVNGRKKMRVDGFVFDEFSLTYNLIIADYSGEEDRARITKTYAGQLFDRLEHFLEAVFHSHLYKDIEPSTPAADLVEQLRRDKDRVRKFRFILITDGLMSESITALVEKEFDGIPVESQIYDLQRIYRICFSDSGKQDIEIDFAKYTDGIGLPCLSGSVAHNDDYKSYLCIVPGSTLADIYDEYGSQLLEGNVRSFLSTKVAVNKKIRETILSCPENFFAYNNGVSATALSLEFKNTENGRVITNAKDFQIINGGQTTASLSNARHRDKADLSKIYVQMKVTLVDSDKDKAAELIKNISRSSNQQNKVSEADFFSTHQFHVRMEQFSRTIYAPATEGAQYETKWFYERARGQYLQAQMRMTRAQKNKFQVQNPKSQLITKTDLAKYRNTWDAMPQLVSKGAQTNFVKFAEFVTDSWNENSDRYNERYFKESVALAILFKYTEKLVTNQPWYEKGYRANIVTYSLATLHYLIAKQFKNQDLDLMAIWNRQSVPSEVGQALILITKYVFDSITDPSRTEINVTQWCKKDACWSKIQKCDILLPDDFSNVLISKTELKTAEKEAKADQKILGEFESQMKVVELGADYWKSVSNFIKSKGYSPSPNQRSALNAACKMPNQLPTSFQCVVLMKLSEEMKNIGFKYE